METTSVLYFFIIIDKLCLKKKKNPLFHSATTAEAQTLTLEDLQRNLDALNRRYQLSDRASVYSGQGSTRSTRSTVGDPTGLPVGWGIFLFYFCDFFFLFLFFSFLLSFLSFSFFFLFYLKKSIEMRTHANGRPYFVDHNTRRTTWDDPRSGWAAPRNGSFFFLKKKKKLL